MMFCRKPLLASLCVVLGLTGFSSCSASREIRLLPEVDQAFLEDVAPLISPDEKRDFLSMHDTASREAFKADFWKRRDTDPSTATNEFQEQYYQRMEEANRLFGDESHGRGHKTDRGRTYLLFGPPDSRYVALHVTHPYEIWSYGPRILRFTDPDRQGNYRLDPITAANAGFWNLAQIAARGGNWRRQTPVAGNLDLHLERSGPGEFVLTFRIPLDPLVFRQDKGGMRTASIRCKVEVAASGRPVQRQEQLLPIRLDPARQAIEKSMAFPVRLRLPAGEVRIGVLLEDVGGDWKGEDAKVYRVHEPSP